MKTVIKHLEDTIFCQNMEETPTTAADQEEPLNVNPVATELSVELPVRPHSARTSSLPRSTGAENEATEGEPTAPKYVKNFVLDDLLCLACAVENIVY
jgi:hypothetical protein